MRPKSYLHALINTFSSVSYYIDVLNTKFWFSFRFFLMSYVALTLLSMVLFHFFDLPRYQSYLSQTFQELQKNFPTHLELKWDGLTLTTVPQQVVQVSYPSFFNNESLPPLLAVVDTSSSDPKSSLAQLKLNSLLFVNSTTLFVSNSADTWSSTSLHDLQFPIFSTPFTLNQSTAPTLFASWQTLGQHILTVLQILYPLFVTPALMIFRLISLAVESLFVFYILRFFGRPRLHFFKIYQIGLHVVVVAETAQLFLTHLFPLSAVPLFAFCFWIFMTIILIQLRHVRMITLTAKK